MIKFYYIFFIAVSAFANSQSYNFDFLTKYNTHNSKNGADFDTVSYFNSDDFSYYLKLSKSEKKFSAFLTDEKKKLVHCFKVLESNVKGEVQFQFSYEYSRNYIPENSSENYHFQFSPVSETAPKEVILKVFKSKKSKKPIFEQNLTLLPANKNLFAMYKKSILRYLHTSEENSFQGNYMVKKVVEKHKDFTCEINLEEYKNIDLELKLPEKLIIDNSFKNGVTSFKVIQF